MIYQSLSRLQTLSQTRQVVGVILENPLCRTQSEHKHYHELAHQPLVTS